MKDRAGRGQLALATLTAVTIAWFVAGLVGLVAVVVAAALTVVVARFVLQRIPGLTGDVYGALCELVETAVLLAFVVGAR